MKRTRREYVEFVIQLFMIQGKALINQMTTRKNRCVTGGRRQSPCSSREGRGDGWARTGALVESREMYVGSGKNQQEGEAACPKEISIDCIALLNRDYVKAQLKQRRLAGQAFP